MMFGLIEQLCLKGTNLYFFIFTFALNDLHFNLVKMFFFKILKKLITKCIGAYIAFDNVLVVLMQLIIFC